MVYYGIYIDSLWLLNFVMNLLCFKTVNHMFHFAASGKRIVLAAATGACLYVVSFLLPVGNTAKTFLCRPAAMLAVVRIAFGTVTASSFLHVCLAVLTVTFLLGGAELSLIRVLPEDLAQGMTAAITLGMGACICAEQLIRKKEDALFCRVELVGKGASMCVTALIDTGNSLTEPISGKPVCLLERNVFEGLFLKGRPEGFRVIPYHSIGKENGLICGYLIPEMNISVEGIRKKYREIYVGVVNGEISASSGYCMIIHPGILGRQKERNRKKTAGI